MGRRAVERGARRDRRGGPVPDVIIPANRGPPRPGPVRRHLLGLPGQFPALPPPARLPVRARHGGRRPAAADRPPDCRLRAARDALTRPVTRAPPPAGRGAYFGSATVTVNGKLGLSRPIASTVYSH